MIHLIELFIGLIVAFALIPLGAGRLAQLTYKLIRRFSGAP